MGEHPEILEQITGVSDSAVVLQGPAGSGKTTVALALYRRFVSDIGRARCLLILPNGAAVSLTASGATLDLNGSSPTLASLSAAPGSMVIFGGTNTLTVSGSPTLAGTLQMGLNKGAALASSKLSVGSASLTYGGTLVVTNLGATALALGDTFTLFSAGGYSGAFTGFTLPDLAANLAWDVTGLTNNGAITVAARPPVVTLVSPTNGASFAAPATINLAASVTTNGNAIARVRFYAGTTNLIGETAAAPFLCAWSNVSAGSYVILARVVYNGVSTADSFPVTVSVTNSPPQIIGFAPTLGGAFQFSLLNSTTTNYTLLVSTNLRNWDPLNSALQCSNGLYLITDPAAANQPWRFYRLGLTF